MSRHISSGLEIGLGSLMVLTSSTSGVSPIQCELFPPLGWDKADRIVVSKWVLRWNLRSWSGSSMVSMPVRYWLIKVVNPDRIPGKVIIIGRYGADKVDKHLPGHIEAVKATDHVVVWQCDAMVSSLSMCTHKLTSSTATPSPPRPTRPSRPVTLSISLLRLLGLWRSIEKWALYSEVFTSN
jgi:hypothetical protein